MKHLLTLAAVALFAVISTTSAHAQQPAAKPAAAAPKASSATAAAPKPAATTPAKPKAAATKFTADQIKDVQTGLQKQKLYTGKINGIWNASTVKAYRAWQKANNQKVDGVLTDDAIAKLKA
jgi:peptidoglycan hydrolase-like protein with peptidoglycan-binding domain